MMEIITQEQEQRTQDRRRRPVGPHYKWVALTNTTLGSFMATLDASIVLIAFPAIFKGIGINPLAPGETSYFLWLLLGYMVVTATLLVTFGRISDMFGRVRLYNLGFLIFAIGSTLLSLTPGTGNTGAIELIIFRLIQGIGSGFLLSNSAAILTDAFPANQRGRALGINQIAGIAGSFIGLIVGGILAVINWRLVFLVSVPVGIAGTIWAYTMLRETATIRKHQKIDWLGNVTFALGLTVFLFGITYGIEPYGGSPMGWSNPLVIGGILLGIALLAAFVWIELHVNAPMFRLDLFKIRMFAAGNIAGFLSALGRGVSSGMRATFQNSATLVSIGFFFSIVTLGLAAALPATLSTGLITNGVPIQAATTIAHLPPTAALFGAFLGYNPIGELLPPPLLHAISPTHQAILLGKTFFPNLISAPFMDGLRAVFSISAALCLIAAGASLLRGKRVVYGQEQH